MITLVTGGAGFIGSHLAERLVREGFQVRVLDDLSTGSRGNLEPVANDIEFVEGDVRDCPTVRKAMRGVETVFHEAALCSVPRSVEVPQNSNAVNVDGTLNVLLAARDEGVRRFVLASSSSVYGNNPELPKRESQPPSPASPYAVTKYTAEMYCRVFHKVYGLETIALRYFNVFGPRQEPNSQYSAVIPKFIKALLRQEPLTIHGDGGQTRDFSYVANVVEANLCAAKADGGFGEAFNVACGQRTSLCQLADSLKKLTGIAVENIHTEPRAGDVRDSVADVAKAESVLGYHPMVDLLSGLRLTVDWYRKSEESAS